MRKIFLILLILALSSCSTVRQNLTGNTHERQQFEIMNTGHIVVPAEINGHPVFMIVDTGAGATLIDLSSAAALSLHFTDDRNTVAIGAGGSGLSIQTSHGNNFKFAGTESKDFTFRVMNLSHVIDALSSETHPVVGVIGVDWLDKHGATIKYSDRTIMATK